MHQIGSGMYVSGRAPDRKRERQLSSGSVATPPYTGGDVSRSGELGRMFDVSAAAWQSQAPSPASSSRRSSGQLPLPPPRPSPSPAASGHLSQLSPSGLLVGPSPSPAPSPARGGSWRKVSRRRAAGGEEAAVVSRGRARLGVPFTCYMLVAVAAAAGVGAGVFCLVEWRRWEVLAASCGAALAAAAVFSWNVRRSAAEAERFFRRSPDTVFDQGDMPIGELVKITGQVTCGRVPLGACFHDAARCVFTSIQMYGRRGWACCCCWWQLRHSEELREEVLRACRGRCQDHLDDETKSCHLRRRQEEGRGVAEPEELDGEQRSILRWHRAPGRRVHQGGGHCERDRRAEEAPRPRHRRRAGRRGRHRLPAGEVHVPRARRGAGTDRKRGSRRGCVRGLDAAPLQIATTDRPPAAHRLFCFRQFQC